MMGSERIALHQVVELPRPPDERAITDPFRASRFAALAAAYHGGPQQPVVWLWRRRAVDGPVALLTSDVSIAPLGAATALAGSLGDQVDHVVAWQPLAVLHDDLVDRPTPSVYGPSVEDGLLPVWREPFALLVVATPVRMPDLRAHLEKTVDRLRYVQARAEDNPERSVEHERLRQWYRELRAGESTGLWRVQLLAGGDDDRAARALGALAAASFDLSDLPYAVRSEAPQEDGDLAATGLVTALTRPPTREVPGVRLVSPSRFDVTPEASPTGEGESGATRTVTLGTVLDRGRRPAGEFELPLESLNRHVFVCGATGAGKSQTVRSLLEQATTQGIPWLCVEPAKAEYRAMSARLGRAADVIVIRPGEPNQLPVGLDPLRPVEGFPLPTHLDLVRALFLAAFDADEPFPQVLAMALTRAYENQGWDIAIGGPIRPGAAPRYPTLADLEACAEQVVDEIGYGREVADNVRGFVRVRLSSLRHGTTGQFLEGGHPIDMGKLLSQNVVLEIEDVGDDRDKAFLMGVVLVAVTEHYRVMERQGLLARGRLRHLTVFEEAHRLFRRTEAAGAAHHAVEMFAALLAEVRAYGEGLIVAEQIPAKLIPDVIKNTAVKIVHRLPAKDDREAVGATMNLSEEQSAYLVTVPPGVAGVFSDGMDQPILVRMPDGTDVETNNAIRAVPPDQIASNRAGRCGADYGAHLTLGAMARGRLLLEDQPWFAVWVELVLLAHLTGWPIPTPIDPERWHRLDQADPVHLDAAIIRSVDEAVADRSPAIVDRTSPAALAQHLVSAMRHLVDNRVTCATHDRSWIAAPFVNAAEEIALRQAQPASADPHAEEQLAKLEAERRGYTASGQLGVVLFGNGATSILERVTGTARDDPDWPLQLCASLDVFDNADWAARLLAVPATREDL